MLRRALDLAPGRAQAYAELAVVAVQAARRTRCREGGALVGAALAALQCYSRELG